jgi:hypothetical protein
MFRRYAHAPAGSSSHCQTEHAPSLHIGATAAPSPDTLHVPFSVAWCRGLSWSAPLITTPPSGPHQLAEVSAEYHPEAPPGAVILPDSPQHALQLVEKLGRHLQGGGGCVVFWGGGGACRCGRMLGIVAMCRGCASKAGVRCGWVVGREGGVSGGCVQRRTRQTKGAWQWKHQMICGTKSVLWFFRSLVMREGRRDNPCSPLGPKAWTRQAAGVHPTSPL